MVRSAHIFFIALVLGLVTAGGHLYSPDEEIMFRVTESIARYGRLDVMPIRDPSGATFATRRGTNGREYAQYGVGNSLAGVPFYWAGQLATTVVSEPAALAALDFQTMSYAPEGPARGHHLLRRFAVSFTGIFIFAATAALLFSFIRRLYPEQPLVAVGTAMAYAAGTMAWAHSRTFFSEPLATFFVLASVAILATSQRGSGIFTPRRTAAAGACFALAMLTRLDSMFAVPGVGLLLLGRSAEMPAMAQGFRISAFLHPKSLARIGAFCVPGLVFVCWQLWFNWSSFGSPFTSAYADQTEGINFSTPILAGLYGFFMSAGKSLLLFSPALLLGLFGWPSFHRAVPLLSWALILVVLGKLLVHSSWQNWAGGWCWGPRHVFMIHVFALVPAAAFFATRSLGRRVVADVILLWGAGVQLYGTSQNFIDFYSLYYRNPLSPPQATVLYGPEDPVLQMAHAQWTMPDGSKQDTSLQALPAPISDSIYVPQNTQWYRYAEMWKLGYTDNLWLRLAQRAGGREAMIQ